MDFYQRVGHIQSIFRGSAINKYKTVLLECKESSKVISGYQWTLRPTKDFTM